MKHVTAAQGFVPGKACLQSKGCMYPQGSAEKEPRVRKPKRKIDRAIESVATS